MNPRQIVTLAGAALALACAEVRAQSLSWDTNTATAGAQGGTGNWVGTNFWFDGANNVAWADNSMATFGATAGNVTVNNNVLVNGMTFTANGYSLSGASTVTLVGPAIDVPTAGHQTFINTSIGGSVGLVKNGPGILALLSGSPNTFTGTTSVNDGTLFFNKTSGNAVNGDVVIGDNQGAPSSARVVYGVSHQIPDTARVTVNSDGFFNLDAGERQETIGTLEMTGGLVSTALGTGALTVSAVQSNASAATAMITGQLNLDGAARTFSVANGAAASDLEVSASISNGGITKTGAGTLVLTGSSSFTSEVAINGGAISVPDVANTGIASPLGAGSSLSFDGGTLIYTGTSSDSMNRSITLNAGGGTIHIPSNFPDLTFSGVIAGSGGLTRTGGVGRLVLTGTNTFSGPVALDGSAVHVPTVTNSGVTGPLGTGTTITINGGGLLVSAAGMHSTNRELILSPGGGTVSASIGGTLELSGTISGPGRFRTTNTGVVLLSGTNTFGGGVFIGGSDIRIANGSAIPDGGEVSIATNRIFDVNNSTETIGSLRSNTTGGSVMLGSGTLTLGADNASPSFDGVISGTGNVVKIGTGTQTLSGASTFTGSLAINGGAISVADLTDSGMAGPLGAGSSLGFDGGTLTFTGNANDSTNRAITLNAGGGRVQAAVGGGTLTLAGIISGPGALNTNGGFVELTAANTFAGALNIEGGVLSVPAVANSGTASSIGAGTSIAISNGAALIVQGSGTHLTNRAVGITGGAYLSPGNGMVTYSGPITGSGGLNVIGPGILVLSGSNTFTGGLSVFNSTLRIAGGNAIPDTATVLLSPIDTPATLEVSNSETIGSLAGGSATMGAVLLGANTLTIGANNDSTSYDGVISGTGSIVKIGSGDLTLSRASTFSGTVTIQNGTVFVPDVAASGVASPLGTNAFMTLGGTGTQGTLIYTGVNDDTLGRQINLAGSGGFIALSNPATTLTLTSPLTGPGVFGFNGPGTLVLGHIGNSHTGATIIGQGVLRLSSSSAIGQASTVVLNNIAGSVLDISTISNASIGALSGGGAAGGNVMLGNAVLAAGANGASTTFSGTISGTGQFRKTGTGTLKLDGTNTYTNTTSVDAGKLQLSGGSAIADSSALNIALNAIAEFLDGTETINTFFGQGQAALSGGSVTLGSLFGNIFDGVISGTGSFTKVGAGTFTLSNAPTYTGATTVNGGTLALNAGMDTAGGSIFIASGANLSARNIVSRRLAGTGTITASGTLIIGDSSSTSGFNFGGTLAVGTNQVVLADADLAELGPMTTLGAGGRLNSLNGASLAAGDSVTVDAAVSASISGDLTNDGTVNGPTSAGQMLSVTGDVNGTGSFTGNVRFTDSFSPGTSAAAVSLENFVFESTHTLSLEIGGLNAGSEHDRLNFTGTGTIDGTLVVLLINSFQPVEGNVFTLLNGGTLSGAFDSIALPALGPGFAWQYSQTANTATLEVIPEPSSATLLLAWVVGASSRRRRADRQSSPANSPGDF